MTRFLVLAIGCLECGEPPARVLGEADDLELARVSARRVDDGLVEDAQRGVVIDLDTLEVVHP